MKDSLCRAKIPKPSNCHTEECSGPSMSLCAPICLYVTVCIVVTLHSTLPFTLGCSFPNTAATRDRSVRGHDFCKLPSKLHPVINQSSTLCALATTGQPASIPLPHLAHRANRHFLHLTLCTASLVVSISASSAAGFPSWLLI